MRRVLIVAVRFAASAVTAAVSAVSAVSGVAVLAMSGTPAAMAVRAGPAGRAVPVASNGHVYVSNLAMNTVSQYAVGPSGQLVPLSPATVATGALTPAEMAMNPSGRNLYVALRGGGDGSHDAIGQFGVGPDGTVTALAPASVPTGAGPVEITVTPDGRFLYVDNSLANMVSQYRIGPTGELSSLSPAAAPVSGFAGELALAPDGRYLYVAGSSFVSQFSIGTDGTLTALEPPTAGAGALDMQITPDGGYLYATAMTSGIDQYRIGATGQLSALEPPVAGAGTIHALEMEMTSTGTFLYSTALDVAGLNSTPPSYRSEVAQFRIGSDGLLVALSPATLPTGLLAVEAVITPTDSYLYVGNLTLSSTSTSPPDTISQFSIGVTGALAPITPPTVPTGAGAGALAATPPMAAVVPEPTPTTTTLPPSVTPPTTPTTPAAPPTTKPTPPTTHSAAPPPTTQAGRPVPVLTALTPRLAVTGTGSRGEVAALGLLVVALLCRLALRRAVRR